LAAPSSPPVLIKSLTLPTFYLFYINIISFLWLNESGLIFDLVCVEVSIVLLMISIRNSHNKGGFGLPATFYTYY